MDFLQRAGNKWDFGRKVLVLGGEVIWLSRARTGGVQCARMAEEKRRSTEQLQQKEHDQVTALKQKVKEDVVGKERLQTECDVRAKLHQVQIGMAKVQQQ